MTEYILTLHEDWHDYPATGRLTISGLPDDHEEWRSVAWRLNNTLIAVRHATRNHPRLWRDWAGDHERAYNRGTVLRLGERPDGRITIKGLPLDRSRRERLLDRLLAVLHEALWADITIYESSGMLSQRYAQDSYKAWLREPGFVTVQYIPAGKSKLNQN